MKKFLALIVLLLGACTPSAVPATVTQVIEIPTSTPDLTGYEKISVYVAIDGEPQSDGGWIPSKVTLFDENQKNIGYIVIDQIGKMLIMNEDSNADGMTDSTKNVKMLEKSLFTIGFVVNGYPISAGNLFMYNNTIYWYPGNIIPWFLAPDFQKLQG